MLFQMTQGSIPSTHLAALSPLLTPVSGIQHPLLDSTGTRHTKWYRFTCRKITHTCKKKDFLSYFIATEQKWYFISQANDFLMFHVHMFTVKIELVDTRCLLSSILIFKTGSLSVSGQSLQVRTANELKGFFVPIPQYLDYTSLSPSLSYLHEC